MALLNLIDHLAFYGAYHADKWNVLVHTIFVPILVFTGLVFAATTGPLYRGELFVPPEWADTLILNLGFILALAYSIFYVLLEPIAGFSAGCFLMSFWGIATTLYSQYGSHAVQVAFGVHILAWVFQFIGHGVCEGRKPALMDNLFQSLVLAPLFVWLHVLFAFGYRPALQAELHDRVDAQLKELRSKSKKQQ